MENQPDPNRYAVLDALDAERKLAATMCALYTDAGLYDLAKDNAARWRKADIDAREELHRLTDETLGIRTGN